MGGTGVIDRFLEVFTRYIDSGFGLLSGEVAFLATTLAAIDITLAAIFWSWGGDDDIIARLVKKTLFVGVFAYLIGNWNSLARIIFESFSGLGLKASGSSLSAADFLKPGRVAQVGIDAGRPILDSISGLMGYISFFENFVQIVVLLFAWIVVLLAFFILAIQLFVTLIEFKLTTLAGFVLIPFGLFGKTAFAAERVLGNVISSGVKVLVLAVIVGIGSTLFSQFTSGVAGNQPTIEDAMAMVLAALSLLGLGIFGPGIANGIVSGGPQLGAGAAAGTALLAGGAAAGAVAGARMAGGAVASAASNVAHGTSRAAGGATMAYALGSAGKSGAAAVGSGMAAVGDAAVGAAASPLRKAGDGMKQSFREGSRAAITNTGGSITHGPNTPPSPPPSADAGQPAWAKAMKDRQTISHGASIAAQGSRLIGDYDADVTFGQSRILLAWNRLILPDGRSIVLERQPASDPRGFAGLQDGTNYHWGGVLKAALVSTLLGVGSELWSGNDSDLARAVRRGTQDSINRAGEQIVSRELNVRPTLTIRPGFPVRVLVTRDLILGDVQ